MYESKTQFRFKLVSISLYNLKFSFFIDTETGINSQNNISSFSNRGPGILNAKTNKWTIKGYAEKQNLGNSNPTTGSSFAQQDY